MRSMRLRIVYGMLVLVVSLAEGLPPVSAQTTATQKTGAPETGYAVKKPVFGGACKVCPWGSIAQIVKEAMKPYGWDVQICFNCAGGPQEARLVAGAKMPPPLAPETFERYKTLGISPNQISPPPNGPVDFGVTTTGFLWWAYQGNHPFAGEGAKQNLRLLAVIQAPMYLIVAVKADLGITDLSQIKAKRWPVRILWDKSLNDDTAVDVLAHYGLTQEAIEAAGGHVGRGNLLAERTNFDVIIHEGGLTKAPEFSVWNEVSEKYDLRYLQLPEDLLAKLAKDWDMERRNLPNGLFRGIDHPIPTVAYLGHAIYGRTDMPDDFAYTVAKAMDEHQDLLPWSHEGYSYNPRTVWRNYGVPLHAGAARYYRERGYMK